MIHSDLRTVDGDSSFFILNSLLDYRQLFIPYRFSNDSMGSLIQGLCLVYSETGDSASWYISGSFPARTNYFKHNLDLDQLRKADLVHINRYGATRLKARSLISAILSKHDEQFWFKTVGGSEVCVEAVYSTLALGQNVGIRFDKILNLTMSHVSTT